MMKRGYKVTDGKRKKLVGVACESLIELLEKGRCKLNIDEKVTAALDDGTIVDEEDYFQTLSPQTIFILYRKNESIATGVDFVLEALRSVNKTYLDTGSKVREALLDKTDELMRVLKRSESKNRAEKNTREEDPEWFEGLDTAAKTKNEFMNRRSRERIRGYFYKFQDYIKKSELYTTNNCYRSSIQSCLEFFKKRLQSDGYFGCYFDRRCAIASKHEETQIKVLQSAKRVKISAIEAGKSKKNDIVSYDRFSYCDVSGNFKCQGKWQVQECEFSSDHHINPYSSKEERILFSTWNLDHIIEKSRSVIPALIKAVESCPKYQSVNFLYFYQLLFTKFNLKLVHVVCHDKSVHDVSCNAECLYT